MQITLNIPDQENLSEKDIKILFAGMMHRDGFLSLGKAAKVAEMGKREFMEVIGNYDFSIFNYSPEELKNEMKTFLYLNEQSNNNRH